MLHIAAVGIALSARDLPDGDYRQLELIGHKQKPQIETTKVRNVCNVCDVRSVCNKQIETTKVWPRRVGGQTVLARSRAPAARAERPRRVRRSGLCVLAAVPADGSPN